MRMRVCMCIYIKTLLYIDFHLFQPENKNIRSKSFALLIIILETINLGENVKATTTTTITTTETKL